MACFGASVIAFARVDLQPFAGSRSGDGDGAVLAIRLKPGRFVGQQVAAADEIAKPIERSIQREDGSRKHRLAAGTLRQRIENSIGISLWPGVFPGAYRINGHTRVFGLAQSLLEAGPDRWRRQFEPPVFGLLLSNQGYGAIELVDGFSRRAQVQG